MDRHHSARIARLFRLSDAAGHAFHTFGAVALLAAMGALAMESTGGPYAAALGVLALLALPVAIGAAVLSAALDDAAWRLDESAPLDLDADR